MEIEILYFEGCPHGLEARKLVEETLAERGVSAKIKLVLVDSNEEAQRRRFLGSPTVRVDGVDVEPGAPDDGFNLECRLYWVEGKPVGIPTREWVEAAIGAAG